MSTDHRKKEREVVAAAEQRYSAKYGSAPDMSSYQVRREKKFQLTNARVCRRATMRAEA